MSNLLEQASLVMIPSGYKEDIVYSVIPTSGAGDLTFTRASNGTRIDSNGNVEVVPWNLLQQSETFDSAPWTANNATITANSTTAPNGTTTADTFTLTAGVDAGVYQAVNGVSNNYTISVYAKYVSGDKYLFLFGPLNSQGAKIWFDIQNGTVSNQLSGFTGTIENAGNGWYKCSIYNTSQAVLDYIQFGISTTNSNRVLSNNSVSYFWGAQVNVGTAKPYFPTTDRLNVPRLTYHNGGGGCPSLLLEKQSTNLITYSEDISNSFATQSQVTITSNNTTSPDGTQNADLLKFDTTTAYILRNQTVNPLTTYTMSVFVKNNNFTSGQLLTFNMSDGVIGGLSAQINVVAKTATFSYAPSAYTSVSGKVEDYGNGWFRVSVTGTSVNGGSGWYEFAASGVTNSCFIWGFSLEVSSYATSYIPTTSSSATRVADVCYKNSISSLIGQSSGVVFADIVPFQFFDGSYIGISDNGLGNRQIFGFEGQSGNSGTLRFYGFYTGNYGTLYAGQRYKIAMAYANNDFVIYVNGTQVVNQTSGTVAGTLSHFGFDSYISSSQNFQGQVNEAILFPTRLTNSELAQLTGNQNYTINQAYESYGVASESPNCVQP